MKIIERLAGGLGGVFAGSIAMFAIRSFFDLGVRILPISGLIIDLLPGTIIGLLLGLLFPRLFKWILIFMPTSIS